MTDKALLVGINKYKYYSSLRGCLNDVKNIRELLTETCGFKDRHLRELTEQKAVKSEFKKELRWLRKVNEGDRAVLYFAGHGSQVLDLDGDEDDKADEVLCLHDYLWKNPDSYILDDELREWAQGFPAGASLTVILDNCHAGTATRMAFRGAADDWRKMPMVDQKASRKRSGASRAVVMEPQALVLSRYIEPPEEVLKKLGGRRRKRSLRAFGEDSLNHIVLAGADAEQCAADAMIDGRFQGAFTYHLCRAIRADDGSSEYPVLIERLRRDIRQDDFSQVPQLEPRTTEGFFLDVQSSPTRKRRENPAPQEALDSKETLLSETEEQYAEVIQQLANLLEAQSSEDDSERQGEEKACLKAVQQLAEMLGRRSWGSPQKRRSMTRKIVYVHGICEHKTGYSNDWWDALAPYVRSLAPGELGKERREVIWSDLVNASSRSAGPREGDVRAQTHELREILTERQGVYEAHSRKPQEDSQQRGTASAEPFSCLDDFSKYMISPYIRRQVIDRLQQVVRPLLENGDALEIVAHSWGSVVAYEGLRELAEENLAGEVRNFFTLGSPLAISIVRRFVRRSWDGSRPKNVRSWINLDATGDFVGGKLKPHFQTNEEHLGLPPGTCETFLGLYSIHCSHSSYFQAGNIEVNRDILGKKIEE